MRLGWRTLRQLAFGLALFGLCVKTAVAGVSIISFEVIGIPAAPQLGTRNSLAGWHTVFMSGFENGCMEDSDRDRLLNCVETNTGQFLSDSNTGTHLSNPDTDADGLTDGDEVLGTLDGLNLRSFGVSPVHKDILIEYDWFDDSLGCGAHSHRPSIQEMNRIRDIFALAPVLNPDGLSGVRLVQDYGQGGYFNGGNLIVDADGEITDGLSAQFFQYKSANFSAQRVGYFHYAILPHYLKVNNRGIAGMAELMGDDFIVADFCYYANVGSDIIHELGHNLNLRHGGDEECNYKPNYNSVMNYTYSGGAGVDLNCDGVGDFVDNYSSGSNAPLNENNLNENLGICNHVPIDWNQNKVLENSVSFDINLVEAAQQYTCGGVLSVLRDYNDWANIRLDGISPFHMLSYSAAAAIGGEVVTCDYSAEAR